VDKVLATQPGPPAPSASLLPAAGPLVHFYYWPSLKPGIWLVVRLCAYPRPIIVQLLENRLAAPDAPHMAVGFGGAMPGALSGALRIRRAEIQCIRRYTGFVSPAYR
jgi:hypothetical protein